MQRQQEIKELERDLSQDIFIHATAIENEKRAYLIRDYSAAILRQDPRCFVKRTRVIYIDGNCYICSKYNQRHCWEASKLHMVCGSLGLGVKTPRWYEFGDPSYTTAKDFMNGHPMLWDWHVWLEDETGRVWDVVPGMWHDLAGVHGHRVKVGDWTQDTVVEGLEKITLKSKGVEYIPAPVETQRILFAMMDRIYQPMLQKLNLAM